MVYWWKAKCIRYVGIYIQLSETCVQHIVSSELVLLYIYFITVNCLDRHDPERAALIFVTDDPGQPHYISYG